MNSVSSVASTAQVDEQYNFVDENVVHRWIIDDKEYLLFRYGEEIECAMFDFSTHTEILRLTVPRQENLTIDETIALYIREYVPVFLPESNSFFLSEFVLPETWSFPNREVRLCEDNQGNLIWCIFEQIRNTARQVPNTAFTDLPFADRVNRFLNYGIPRNVARIASVAQSRIKRESSIDIDNWAVSLVCTKQSDRDGSFISRWCGHAMIAIEGVDEERECTPFIKFVHLTKESLPNTPDVKGSIEISEGMHADYSEYYRGSETWIRTKELANAILQRAAWEMRMHLSGEPQVFFNFYGSDALGIAPIRVKECNSFEEARNFIHSAPAYERDMRYINSESGDIVAIIGNSQSIFIKREDTKFVIYVLPDNCMTYVRKRLSLAGIDLPLSSFGRLFFTRPRGYIEESHLRTERVIIPFRIGQYRIPLFTLDVTNEIESQIIDGFGEGKSWELPLFEADRIGEWWRVVNDNPEKLLITECSEGNPVHPLIHDLGYIINYKTEFKIYILVEGSHHFAVDLKDALFKAYIKLAIPRISNNFSWRLNNSISISGRAIKWIYSIFGRIINKNFQMRI